METVNVVLKKASERIGFQRVRFQEKNVPTNINNVVFFVFFGDLKSTFVASSLLLKRYREETKGSKYFILCSWPGNSDLFPFVDEYWEPIETEQLKSVYLSSDSFLNGSNYCKTVTQLLNNYIPEDVLDFSMYSEYYSLGFNKEFFNRFNNIKRYLNSIPSINVLGQEPNRMLASKKKNIFIYPNTHVQNFKDGKLTFNLIPQEFWASLIENLEKSGYSSVICQDYLTYDLSSLYHDKYLIHKNSNMLNTMALMRGCHCVLDVFCGISKYAYGARSPSLICQDRVIFNHYKEYEIDDIIGKGLPKNYVFSFPEICDFLNKHVWKSSLYEVIISKLDVVMANVDFENLPNPVEIYDTVLYSSVRDIKRNKLGVKFIQIPKI